MRVLTDLRGVIVALVTPFTADGKIDEGSFAKLAGWLLAEGVDGLVLNGTTGECPTVRWPEVERLLGILREVVAGRVPILVGTGTHDTAESVERTTRARVLGADAAFAVVPYYSRPAPAGVIEHFRRIVAVGLPTVAYNIPHRTGLTLDLATLRAVLALPGIIGLKESSGSVDDIAALASAGGPAILCGDDELFLAALEAGARGGILAAANVVPGGFAGVYRAFERGQPLAARVSFGLIRPLVKALFAEPNPAPAKWALAHLGRIASGTLRLPQVPISPALAARLAALLRPAASASPPAAGTDVTPARSDADIERFAERFGTQQIAAAEWTHSAHLVTGAWHVFRLGPDEALARMRTGIRRLNQSHGTPETPTRGYHETITRAYIELMAMFLARFADGTPLATRVAALLGSRLAVRDALLTCYARDRLMSPEARAAWVEPDRCPLHPEVIEWYRSGDPPPN